MSPNFIHYTRVATESSYATEFASHHPAHHKIKRLCWNRYDLVLVLGEQRLVGGFAGLKGARERELGVNSLDTMGGVQVLDKGDLVAGCGALARDDGGVGKEKFPDLVLSAVPCKPLDDQTYSVPSIAILREDLLLVGDPVSVPSPESR
jgi:hypothetical protein